MKYILTIPILFMLYSCGNTKEERAIIDYVQTSDGVKTDMSAQIISIEKVKDLSGLDSMLLFMSDKLKGENDTATIEWIERRKVWYNNLVLKADSLYNQYEFEYNQEVAKSNASPEMLELLHEYRKEFKKKRDDFKSQLMRTSGILDTAIVLQNKQGVLASVYKCSYSIKNPLLNNAKQETTKHFIISAQGNVTGSY